MPKSHTKNKNTLPIKPPLTLRNAVLAAHLVWAAHKCAPTPSLLQPILSSHTLDSIDQMLKTPEFAAEMVRKGIPWGDRDALDERQLLAMAEVANPLSGRNLAQRLAAAGVSHFEWAQWRKNPIFERYYAELTNDLFQKYKPELEQAVLDQGLKGNMRAIEFIHSVTDGKADATQQIEDLQLMVRKIMEIILEVVPEPDRLKEIAARISLLSAVPTIQPSFKEKARELYNGDIH